MQCDNLNWSIVEEEQPEMTEDNDKTLKEGFYSLTFSA